MTLQERMTGARADTSRRRGAPITYRAVGLLAALLAGACTKVPDTGGNQQKTGWLDNNVGVSRTLTPGTTSASEVFQLADGALNCVLTILPVVNDNSTFYQSESGQIMGTVSGEMNCNNQGGATFTDIAVPGKQSFPYLGVVLDLNSITRRYGESGPSVDVTLYANCPSTGCPGAGAFTPGSGSSLVVGGRSPSSGLGAKEIVSPGAAQFQVAFPGRGMRECWVYVWSVADSRQANSDNSYPTEAPVAGEVWCAPYAPVVFNVSVPSNTFAELRPRDSNSDGPPVLLTFWRTTPIPLKVDLSVAADCPNGTCPTPPPPGTTPAPVTPGPGNGGSLSGTDTVFNPEKHWYLCRGGISEDGQATYCPIAGFQCLRSPGSYTDATFLQCAATSSFCEYGEGRTFSECRMNGGRIGWKYCNSSNQWDPCQEPANEPGQCAWVFAQLESLWGEYLRDVGSAQAALLQQKSGCSASAAAATPTAPATSATSSYAAGNTPGNTAPPAEQSLCTESCGAGRHCVLSLDFSAFKGVGSLSGLKAYHPACRTLAEFRADSASKVASTSPNAIGYRQCQPPGLIAWCGLERVLLSPEGGEPRVSTCARVIPGTSLHNGLRRAGYLGRMPACTQ